MYEDPILEEVTFTSHESGESSESEFETVFHYNSFNN